MKQVPFIAIILGKLTWNVIHTRFPNPNRSLNFRVVRRSFSIEVNRSIDFGNRTKSNSPQNFANPTQSNVLSSNTLTIEHLVSNKATSERRRWGQISYVVAWISNTGEMKERADNVKPSSVKLTIVQVMVKSCHEECSFAVERGR